MEAINRINRIIYFGTGIHFECVSHFPHVSEFVFVDTQPRSEFDGERLDPNNYCNTFIDQLLRDGIKHTIVLTNIREVSSPYSSIDHQLPFVNPTLFTFVNQTTNQTIRYYISTNIRYNLIPELSNDILEADALIVSGYYPDKILFDHFDIHRPKQFLGYSRTCYRVPMEEMEDTIYCDLYSDKYFDHYYLVDFESGALTKYNNFKDLVAKEKGIVL